MQGQESTRFLTDSHMWKSVKVTKQVVLVRLVEACTDMRNKQDMTCTSDV